MTSIDQRRCFSRAAPAWLLAAALSAAGSVALAQDNQPAAATPAAPSAPAPPAAEKPAPSAPAAPAPSIAPAAPALPPQPQPPAANKPGFLEALGRWWQQGSDDFKAKMKDAQKKMEDFNKQQNEAAKEAMKNAAEATKNAATAIVRLPGTRWIETHERCAVAANGAPDCQDAAANACKAKGFNTGQPLDVSSSEKCVTTMWLSGSKDQTPCKAETETVVTRAVCQ